MELEAVVIGLGKQSREDHLPALIQSQYYKLVAVCDTDPRKLEESSEKYNVPGYTDIEQLIQNRPFQVAVVCVPHYAYFEIIKTLAAAGKHIIKEKPFASNSVEASKFLKFIELGNVYLGVTVQRRFNPIYQAFHQLKRSIGKIYSIDGAYTMNVASLDTDWRASKELAGGGALIDMGYHFVDLLVWYFGIPTSVTARLTRGNRPGQLYDVEDTAHLLFDYNLDGEYDEKLVGNFVISRVYPEKQEYIKVFGTNGSIEVSRGMIRRLDVSGNEVEHLERKGGWPSAAVAQLDYFADKIKHFIPGSALDLNEHIKHVAIIEAAYESDRTSASCRPNKYLARIIENV